MNAVLSFKSHTAGKNADVTIYNDRIEWSQKRGLGVAFWTLTFFTMGLWALTLLIPRSSKGTEMVPMKHVTSVTTARRNAFFTAVRVITSGNTVDFVVPSSQAGHISSTLRSLILAA